MKHFLYCLLCFSYRFQIELTRRFTASGLAVLSWIVICGFLSLDTNQSVTYQIFTLLLSILIIAIASRHFFRYRFSATRTLPRFASVGIKLKYRIVIHNKSNKTQNGLKLFENFADPRPTLKELTEIFENKSIESIRLDFLYYRWLWLISRNQGVKAKALDLPSLPPNSKTEVVFEIEPSYRGTTRFTSITVARPDPFGLVNAWISVSLPQSLLILPKLYKLPRIELPGSKRYQSAGITLALSVGESEEFRSLRDYRPGDSLRKIHWKSWAKVGHPIVKEEQDEFLVRHAIILDTFQTAKYSEILEEAVSIAASFACDIETQESLLDLIFVGNRAYCFTIGRGLSSSNEILEILASVVACQDKSFDSLIPIVMERVSLLNSCIAIFLCWDENRRKLVNYLRDVGVYITVFIITDKPELLHKFNSEFTSDELATFHILTLGKIQEGLMSL
ncbi:DUF58 domain-containing protein [Aetokthonos hydrillicola Thurmond2011]|jgi:uncharacterized protein (DUF58 family)|uniref:DUF58 domain-containing protein n=1 Tax=Aetokthonos hydrillicola Thurmond2011 TaxID=2712845 RepID=A0AAP5MAC9_9CYAN|nr:DUF58 domain-containing protein [Aetokthonos hydrillicola]MBO3461801.1 DUF58 domain-containing protein [Aetokthonos hydrillicola CCALA 1050]MBW4589945.1 DUF58 domain-containing protein [Aetokthonos hydrillicola CCALA 1050]MDR9895728.1 DUF58 domain-containing protein [Aetokthonos hydrillicola Thurmond2011]